MIRHQIGLLRLSQQTRRELIALLNDTEDKFSGTLLRELDKLVDRRGVDVSDKRVAKVLKELEKRIKEIRQPSFVNIRKQMRSDLGDVIEDESNFMGLLFTSSLPVLVDVNKPDLRVVKGLITSQRLHGPGKGMSTLDGWLGGILNGDIARAMAEVRIGLTNGLGARAIVRSIVGTGNLGSLDGTTQITRNALQTLNRTAVIHFSSQTRRRWLSENQNPFLEEIYTATLDSATTPICRSLDGDIYPLGEGPHPPVHTGCRSLRVAYMNAVWASTRPMKPVTQRMLLREYAEQNNLGSITSRNKLPFGHKTKFDNFARIRVRELVGEVPATLSFKEWLPLQPRSFIEDHLGIAKAKLFIEGKLPISRFVDETGEEYTLAELAKRDRQAFIDAGLDPNDFGG